MLEGPVAQDVTTPPLPNEVDVSTHTHAHGRNATAVIQVLAAMKR